MYINKPQKVIFWDVDEAVCFLLPLGACSLLGHFVLGVIAGIAVFYALKYLKSKVGISHLAHSLYWILPTARGRQRIYIPSYKREFIG